ncbi:DUF3575 domain-containing protein [Myroides sp. LJL119]
MKKLLLGLFLMAGSFQGFSQALNEVKINILNTMIIESVELGYEHFIDVNQSIGVDLFINDRFSYHSEKSSKGQKFKTTSVGLNYNYYLGAKNGANGSGYVFTPFVKYRFGNFHENKFDTTTSHNVRVTTDMNSFIFGIGAGYKWALGDSFIVNPFIDIARNFSQKVNDRFSAIEINAGINIGYRF